MRADIKQGNPLSSVLLNCSLKKNPEKLMSRDRDYCTGTIVKSINAVMQYEFGN